MLPFFNSYHRCIEEKKLSFSFSSFETKIPFISVNTAVISTCEAAACEHALDDDVEYAKGLL